MAGPGSRQTAAGFPPKGSLVKASTWVIVSGMVIESLLYRACRIRLAATIAKGAPPAL